MTASLNRVRAPRENRVSARRVKKDRRIEKNLSLRIYRYVHFEIRLNITGDFEKRVELGVKFSSVILTHSNVCLSPLLVDQFLQSCYLSISYDMISLNLPNVALRSAILCLNP